MDGANRMLKFVLHVFNYIYALQKSLIRDPSINHKKQLTKNGEFYVDHLVKYSES